MDGLSTLVFKYVSANPHMRSTPAVLHQQFAWVGYTHQEIDIALSDLFRDGSLHLDDNGFIYVGLDVEVA